MSSGSSWDRWPCHHACTAFFKIAAEHVVEHIPKELVLYTDKEGRAEIELGYVHFRASHGLPELHEISWAIRVARKKGCGMAFFEVNLGSDEQAFLDLNQRDGFEVATTPFSATTDIDRREFAFRDARGHPVVTLRHQPRGSIPLPFYPFTTEVWTKTRDHPLQRRLFRWWGTANVHLSPPVPTTFTEHPFFRGVAVTRAQPIPFQVMASARETTSAAQLFTKPVRWR